MARGGRRSGAGRKHNEGRRERVSTRIRPELLSELERIAEAQGRPLAQLLAMYIETGMMVWAENPETLMPLVYQGTTA